MVSPIYIDRNKGNKVLKKPKSIWLREDTSKNKG